MFKHFSQHLNLISIRQTLKIGRPYWTRTSDLSHVKGTRYQLRQETIIRYLSVDLINTTSNKL